jgi:hypothetical protein
VVDVFYMLKGKGAIEPRTMAAMLPITETDFKPDPAPLGQMEKVRGDLP